MVNPTLRINAAAISSPKFCKGFRCEKTRVKKPLTITTVYMTRGLLMDKWVFLTFFKMRYLSK